HCAQAMPTKSEGKPAPVTCRSLLIDMLAVRLPVEVVQPTTRSSANQPKSRPCHWTRSTLPKSTPSGFVPAKRSRRKRAAMPFSLRKPIPAVRRTEAFFDTTGVGMDAVRSQAVGPPYLEHYKNGRNE